MSVLRKPSRRSKPVEIDVGLERLANSLAERDQRGEIKLTAESRRLVKAILSGKDAIGLANTLAERDDRGEIKMSREVLELVQSLLSSGGSAEAQHPDAVAARESHATEVIRGEGGRFKGRRRI